MKSKHLLTSLVLFCCFFFTVFVFAAFGRHFTDADMASEFVYASLLNREGSLHTNNWVYSSELRIVAPTPVYRLALSLFSSWHIARVISAAFLLACVLAAFLYMLHPCHLIAGGLLSACIFSLPFAHVYAYFVCYGSHYTIHLILIYLMMGMLLRAEQKQGRVRRLLLSLLFSLWGGLGGVRIAMMFAAPAAIALIWECISIMTGNDAKAACSRLPKGQLLCLAAILAGNFIGLFLNMRILSSLFAFDSHIATPVVIPTAEEFFSHLWDFFSFFGMRESSRMLSARGIATYVSIGLGLSCLCALIGQIKRKTLIPAADRILARFAIAALFLGFFVNLFSQNFGSQYYIVGLIAAVVSVDSYLACTNNRPKELIALAALVFASCFALETIIFVRQEMPKTATNEEQAAEWLLQNGYTRGYATFWHGAPITEASNGQIEIWVLEEPVFSDNWRNLHLNDILQEKKHFSEPPEDAVFVCLFDNENSNPPSWASESHLAVRANWGSVYTYENAAALHELLQ